MPLTATTLLATIPVGKNPGQVVMNPAAHLVYVVNQGSNTVSVIDSESLTVKKVLTVGNKPSAIAINPPANLVYVASASGNITAISGTQVALSGNVGGAPSALVVDTVLNQLYVMDTSRNQIEIFNATQGTPLGILHTSLTPTAMALNVATGSLFVACSGASGSVVVIDGTHRQILTTVPVATGTTSISVDPVTNVAVLVSPTANLHTIIDAANGYSVQTETSDSGAKPFATVYDTGSFLSADNGDGNIFFSDGSGIVTLGDAYTTDLQGATGLATNPTTNQMVVLYAGTDAAYLIDLLNPLFFQNYHLLIAGLSPAGVAFDPLTSRMFISNSTDGTVSVFDVSPSEQVDAYEGSFGGNSLNFNYIEANPATGNIYTLRLGNLYAINEVAAGVGDTGQPQNTAGVTAIPLASVYSSAIAVNCATNKIYAGDSAGFFYSVDGASNVATLITSIPSTANIGSIAVDYATNRILAWDSVSGNLFVLDGSTNALLKTVLLTPAEIATIQVDPIRNLAYVAVLDSAYVIDPAAGTIVANITLPAEALGSALNPALSRLYVITSRHLLVIDTSANAILTDIALTSTAISIAVNPFSGNYYVGAANGNGATDIFEYNPATNTLIADFSNTVYPAITGADDLKANPLTDTMYVGSERGSFIVAAIDERSGSVSGLAPLFESAAYALAVDLSSGVLAGAGYSYTSLFFPTTDISGDTAVPIAVTGQGVPDSQTIATQPLFRTRNTQPTFLISAASNFGTSSQDLVPRHAFYQVDGWQSSWKALTLTPKQGTLTSTAKAKLSTLSTGRHILYVYASIGDVATVQAGLPTGNSVGNSPVISPIGSVVFTVEK
jgi:YVTN family beta-propeller protein